MDQTRRIMVNCQIRDIATLCMARIAGNNYPLIEQLFKAKVEKLFTKELPAFQEAEPNFKDLLVWFEKFVRIEGFTKKLNERG